MTDPAAERRSRATGTPDPNYLGNPIGDGYDPTGEELTVQEAVERIDALNRRASQDCYLPEHPDVNHRNAGRVRAFAQALMLLERAGIEPDDGELYLDDDEEMQP